MSFKNIMADVGTTQVQISKGRNKIGRYISLIISIISLIISLIAFIFSWKAGLIFLAISALFFGISRLSKYANKINDRTIEKLQAMKTPNENERI
jgi:ABC-type transport system involved in cytochrome bd biosynthesis fused ATPase/permease subunit